MDENEKKIYNEQETSRAVCRAVIKSEFAIIGKRLTMPLCLIFLGLNIIFNYGLMDFLNLKLISNQMLILVYVLFVKKAIIYYRYGKFGPISKENTYNNELYKATKSIYLKIGRIMLVILMLILFYAIYLKFGGGSFGTN